MAPQASGSSSVMNRVFTAGMALTAATVAVTGVFIAKIVHSAAAPAPSTSTGSNSGFGDDNGGTTDPNSQGGFFGGGQVGAPQQNQAPVGGSNGS